MTKRLKINAAIFVCLAFVFRLLFVNFSFLPEFKHQGKHGAHHLSSAPKKRRLSDIDKTEVKYYSPVEVSEESSDTEEGLVKASAGAPLILSVLFSFFLHLSFSSGPGRLFDLIKCQLYPKKYLALSILRI